MILLWPRVHALSLSLMLLLSNMHTTRWGSAGNKERKCNSTFKLVMEKWMALAEATFSWPSADLPDPAGLCPRCAPCYPDTIWCNYLHTCKWRDAAAWTSPEPLQHTPTLTANAHNATGSLLVLCLTCNQPTHRNPHETVCFNSYYLLLLSIVQCNVCLETKRISQE